MTEPAPLALDAHTLRALLERQKAFLEARLGSAKAEAEWRANLPSIFGDFLSTKVGALVDAEALGHLLDIAAASEVVEKVARPAARRALAVTLAELRKEKGKAGERVPPEAKKKLDRLVARPGLLPERLLRELVEQEAVEEMMRDVLFDALKEFSEKVNPFVAEWGLPALLKRLGPFGMGKGFETMRADFDKRLEPEIRKFLKGFSKKGLRHAVQITIEKADEPKSIALRKHLVGWVLEQEIASMARGADAETIALGQEIAVDIVAAELAREASRAKYKAMLEEAVTQRNEKSVGEVLVELGIVFVPDFDAIAAATWPAVKAALGSPTAKAWIGATIDAFYEAEIAALAG